MNSINTLCLFLVMHTWLSSAMTPTQEAAASRDYLKHALERIDPHTHSYSPQQWELLVSQLLKRFKGYISLKDADEQGQLKQAYYELIEEEQRRAQEMEEREIQLHRTLHTLHATLSSLYTHLEEARHIYEHEKSEREKSEHARARAGQKALERLQRSTFARAKTARQMHNEAMRNRSLAELEAKIARYDKKREETMRHIARLEKDLLSMEQKLAYAELTAKEQAELLIALESRKDTLEKMIHDLEVVNTQQGLTHQKLLKEQQEMVLELQKELAITRHEKKRLEQILAQKRPGRSEQERARISDEIAALASLQEMEQKRAAAAQKGIEITEKKIELLEKKEEDRSELFDLPELNLGLRSVNEQYHKLQEVYGRLIQNLESMNKEFAFLIQTQFAPDPERIKRIKDMNASLVLTRQEFHAAVKNIWYMYNRYIQGEEKISLEGREKAQQLREILEEVSKQINSRVGIDIQRPPKSQAQAVYNAVWSKLVRKTYQDLYCRTASGFSWTSGQYLQALIQELNEL